MDGTAWLVDIFKKYKSLFSRGFNNSISMFSFYIIFHKITWVTYFKGLLLENKSDMAIQMYVTTQKRMNIVDFLTLSDPFTGEIYIRNPANTFDWMAYINPLRWDAWISVILFCNLISVFIWIVLIFRKLICEEHMELS